MDDPVDREVLKRLAKEILRVLAVAEGQQPPVQPPVVPPIQPPVQPPVTPPGPVVPSIAFEPEDLGELVEPTPGAGAKADMTIRTTGLSEVSWVAVEGSEPYNWRGDAVRQPTSGAVKVTPTFMRSGEFVKAWDARDMSVSKDSPRVRVKNAAVPQPPPGGSGPKDFLAPLKIGLNIERSCAWTSVAYGGQSLQNNVGYYRYLASLGVTHCRFFLPWRYEQNMGLGTSPPGNDVIDKLLDSVQASLDGGMLRAFVDMTDVMSDNEINRNIGQLEGFFRRFAQRIKERNMPADRVSPGPYNEIAADNHDRVNNDRNRSYRVIREVLPNHILTINSIYWGDPEWLEKGGTWAPPADKNAIMQTHWYHMDFSEAHWRWVEEFHKRFEARHGIPVYVGEAGYSNGWGGNGHEWQNRVNDIWTPSLWNMTTVMPHRALSLWSMTNGSAWRMNRSGTDATLIPEVENHIRENSGRIRRMSSGAVMTQRV